MNCPLCKNKEISIIETFSIQIIKQHYLNAALDVNYLFNDIDSLDYLECNECRLKFFNPIVLGDSRYYSHLQKEDWYFLHEDKTEFEFSKQYIKSTDNVLDVGSGRGVFLKHINCAFYQGLESSNKALELANSDGVNVISESVQEHCKNKKDFYDVVVIFQVLEHVANIDDFIRSSIAALKKNGKLIVAVPNNDSFIKDYSNNFLNLPPHHQLHWNEYSLSKLASLYNLEKIEVFKERVTSIHREYFYYTLEQRLFRKISGRVFHIVEDFGKCKTSHLKGYLIKAYVGFLKLFRYHESQDGQTIISVYKKL
ncbi:MAG: class I SAM-dependent methyltransferase [Rickettsiales bacterium]|jgi:2-polyprenyl-3-methyl-5-hydroxy-6-metoxy-1,4-benzoquinol methylase|nr:class I SAM-dependent methyltransferase [Rickettsiales bacterium]